MRHGYLNISKLKYTRGFTKNTYLLSNEESLLKKPIKEVLILKKKILPSQYTQIKTFIKIQVF